MIYLIAVLATTLITVTVVAVQKINDRKKVRVVIFWNTRKIGIYKREPENNHVTVKGHTFVIDDDNYTEYKGMRAYVYSEKDAQTLNPFDLTPSEPNPKRLNAGIKNNIIDRLINAGSRGFGMEANFTTIMLIAIAGVLGIVTYLGYTAISDLQADLDVIKTWVEGFGGSNG
jgi:hypothetical protein